MLYDPKWEAPAIYSLAGLVAWLEKQPATGAYNFFDCEGGCLLGQYLTARGEDGWRYEPYERMKNVAEDIAFGTPWTYGAALERARAALS